MGDDANTADDPNGEDSSAPVEAVRGLLNRGKEKAKELGTDAQQRLHAYNQNPKLLEQDLEALAQKGSEASQDAVDRIREAGGVRGLADSAARQRGWRDTTEMLQAHGADSPAVDAYLKETGPAGEQFASRRFPGAEFEPFKEPLADADDALTYAVAVRSEAYLRQEDVDVADVFVEYTTDADALIDINEETTLKADFYTVD